MALSPDAIVARRSILAGLMLAALTAGCTNSGQARDRTASEGTDDQSLAVTPEVRALKPKVEGALSATAITEVVESDLAGLEGCYAKALGRNPKAAGRVIIHFIVGSEGKVERASVAGSQVQDKIVGRCFSNIIAKLEFAEPDDRGSVDVMLPFALAPRIVGAAPAEADNHS